MSLQIKIAYRRKKPGISMRITRQGDISVSASIGTSRQQISDFLHANRDWIENALLRWAEAQQTRQSIYDRLPLETAEQRVEAQRRIVKIVDPMLTRYSELVGVRISGVTINNARTRWGSCNHHLRKINLSIYLLLLPEWCIEHVVAHECAHLLEPNHGPRFYAVMDRIFPRWREARAETRKLLKGQNQG